MSSQLLFTWNPSGNFPAATVFASTYLLLLFSIFSSRIAAVPCVLIITIAVDNSNLTDQPKPLLDRAMERAYATSPTPTVNGDEADFRKYLDDGGNKLAVDPEKGVSIRASIADGYLQVESLTTILATSNAEERRAPEEKMYATSYLVHCIEQLLTYGICIGIRFLPIFMGLTSLSPIECSKIWMTQ